MKAKTKLRVRAKDFDGKQVAHHATRDQYRADQYVAGLKCNFGCVLKEISVWQGQRLIERIEWPHPAVPKQINVLTQKLTAFESFAALVDAKGYFPSLRCISGCPMGCHIAELTTLADAYDQFQERRGDRRRAFRS